MKGISLERFKTEEQRKIVKACNSFIRKQYCAYRLSLLVLPSIVITLVILASAVGFYPGPIATSLFALLLLIRLLPGDGYGIVSHALVGIDYASYRRALAAIFRETQIQLQAAGVTMKPGEWEQLVQEIDEISGCD